MCLESLMVIEVRHKLRATYFHPIGVFGTKLKQQWILMRTKAHVGDHNIN